MIGLLTSGPGLAAIAIAFALGFGGIQTYRLKGCQADSAKLTAQVTVMGAQIGEQNRAVEALAAEGARKAAAASQALAKAEGKARVWADNALRLQAVLTARKPTDDKTCSAAWAEIRKPQ